MEKISARTGWLWLKQGFSLFSQQPGSFAALFFVYMFMMLLAGVIPLIGQILPIVLVPAFSVAFMRACVTIEAHRRVLPTLLTSGFQKPVVAPLIFLGVLYLLAAMLAIGASALVDGGLLWQIVTGQIKPTAELIKDSSIGSAILLAVALYVPAAMAFCFSAALIYWQRMSVGKAMFYSFFAVARAFSAFMAFAFAWFGISMVVSQLIVLLLGGSELAVMFLAPLSVVMTVIMHCSLYAAYRQIFGAPADDAADVKRQ